MAVLLVIVTTFLALLSCADSETHGGNLTCLNNNIDGCPGRNESFLCYTPRTDANVSIAFTLWSGSAIDFLYNQDMKQLSLSHREIQNNASKKDGHINSTAGVIAYCVESDCSTSQLDVILSPELSGLSVSCGVQLENTNAPIIPIGTKVLNVLNDPPVPSNLNCEAVVDEPVKCTWIAPNLPDCMMNVSYNVMIIRNTADTTAEFSLVEGAEYQASVTTIFDNMPTRQSEAIFTIFVVRKPVTTTNDSAATSPTMLNLTLVTVVVILLGAFCFGRGKGAPAQHQLDYAAVN